MLLKIATPTKISTQAFVFLLCFTIFSHFLHHSLGARRADESDCITREVSECLLLDKASTDA